MILRTVLRTGVLACLILSAVSVSAAVQPGDLVLTEFMANPNGVSDTQGEWLELFNTTSSDIDLRGLSLSDDGSNLHVIASAAPVTASAGGYVLLGRSGNIDGSGNVGVDYVYSGFTLNNSSDQIVLSRDAVELWRLDYTASMITAGRSTELQALTSSGPVYGLTPTTLSYDGGINMGTPGAPNSQPLSVAPVPLPPAVTLFLSAVAIVLGGNFATRDNRIARRQRLLPAG